MTEKCRMLPYLLKTERGKIVKAWRRLKDFAKNIYGKINIFIIAKYVSVGGGKVFKDLKYAMMMFWTRQKQILNKQVSAAEMETWKHPVGKLGGCEIIFRKFLFFAQNLLAILNFQVCEIIWEKNKFVWHSQLIAKA